MLQELINKAPWNKRIEILQVINDLNQEKAAELCGTTQKVYWNWINAKAYPRKNSRRAIASAYGVSEEDIFGGSGRDAERKTA
jgi:transcriptional regulator with XRE-family HTH domain